LCGCGHAPRPSARTAALTAGIRRAFPAAVRAPAATNSDGGVAVRGDRSRASEEHQHVGLITTSTRNAVGRRRTLGPYRRRGWRPHDASSAPHHRPSAQAATHDGVGRPRLGLGVYSRTRLSAPGDSQGGRKISGWAMAVSVDLLRSRRWCPRRANPGRWPGQGRDLSAAPGNSATATACPRSATLSGR